MNWSGKTSSLPRTDLTSCPFHQLAWKRQIIGFHSISGGCQSYAILEQQLPEFQCEKTVPPISSSSEQDGQTPQSPCLQMWLINCAEGGEERDDVSSVEFPGSVLHVGLWVAAWETSRTDSLTLVSSSKALLEHLGAAKHIWRLRSLLSSSKKYSLW